MAKPSSHLDWTEGNPDQPTISVEPSAAKKEAGWFPDERPPREFMNWLFQRQDEWNKYFEGVTDAVAGQSIIYDATVGPAGDFPDINALMADPGIASLKNILVTGPLAVDDTQVIDQDGMNFTFKPNASITKNGVTGASLGLQITGNRTRIIDGRFIGFNAGGNKAVEIAGDNNLISQCFFNDNTLEIDDLGNNNVLSSNIVEV